MTRSSGWQRFGWGLAFVVMGLLLYLRFGMLNHHDLFKAYKAVNPNVAGQFEEDFVAARVLKRCRVGGKYIGLMGYVDFKTTFQMGRPNPNPEMERLFVWAVFYPHQVAVAFRGGDHVEELWPVMKTQGCEPPEQPLPVLPAAVENRS
jgi:hypothetical protein